MPWQSATVTPLKPVMTFSAKKTINAEPFIDRKADQCGSNEVKSS